MVSSSPLLSIIIPSYNQFEGLKRTVNSVREIDDVEVVVIDGGSTDGSAQWILDNQNHIPKLRTAPDNGIYDAMNKGIKEATGDFIGFLNSDDVYNDLGCIESIALKLN